MWVAPSSSRRRELDLDHVDGDDHAARRRCARPGSPTRPTPPQPKTATVEPGSTSRRVEHGADAGRDAAADQRGAVERHVVADLHDARSRAPASSRRSSRGWRTGPPACRSSESRGGSPGAAAQLRVAAEVRAAGEAHLAVAAEDREAGDDVVARLARTSTWSPTASTMPAASWPRIGGRRDTGRARRRSAGRCGRRRWRRCARALRVALACRCRPLRWSAAGAGRGRWRLSSCYSCARLCLLRCE